MKAQTWQMQAIAARLCHRNRNRNNAAAADIQGLPCFDEQKKNAFA